MTTARGVVDVPCAPAEAFARWSTPEVHARCLSGVEEVQVQPDGSWRWTVEWGGRRRDLSTIVVDRRAPVLFALRSTSGPLLREVARFRRVGPRCTQVRLQLTIEPATAFEQVAHWWGLVDSAVERDLQRFAALVAEPAPA